MEQEGEDSSPSFSATSSRTTVTKYHKLDGLKQHRFISHSLGGSKSEMSSSGLKPRVQQGCVPAPRPSPVQESHSEAPGPFKAAAAPSLCSLCAAGLLPVKTLVIALGPSRIIWDHLPHSRFLIYHIRKVPFCHMRQHSQVLSLRVWISCVWGVGVGTTVIQPTALSCVLEYSGARMAKHQ